MTCEVCQHCQGSVSRTEGYTVRSGYSYHTECHKCYVCSETDLHNAEVFKGVIFCSSCSQRIFQGCSTARRTKSGSRPRRGRSASKSKSRRRARSSGKELRRTTNPIPTGVIELAHLGALVSKSSEDLPADSIDISKHLEITTELALQVGKRVYETPLTENNTWDNLQKDSKEIGVITDVTLDLLRQMECPVVENWERKIKSANPRRKPAKVHPVPSPSPHRTKCSDWRIAELGQSTEIANMVLKKKSEMPVIYKSLNPLKKPMSPQPSLLNRETAEPDYNKPNDESGDSNEDWLNASTGGSPCEKGSDKRIGMQVGNILKMPIECFKRNILQRSSLIDIIVNSEEDSNLLLTKFKKLFREKIIAHQRRGVRRLYSTINRRRVPYKLGWPKVMRNGSTVHRMKRQRSKGCKHFRGSHSYRCMRSLVMRNAGPTKSELAMFRSRLRDMVMPHWIKQIYYLQPAYAEIMSRACGSEVV